jgi:hypothetical protein
MSVMVHRHFKKKFMKITCDENHFYRVGGKLILSTTQQIAIAGLIDYSQISKETLDYAAERGIFVHDAVYLYLYDDLDMDSLDESYAGYVHATIKFLGESGFEVHESEEVIYSERLRTAGKPDLLGKYQGSHAIVEWKTGSLMMPTTALQLAGYEILEDSKHFTRRLGVHLKPNGNYRIHEYKDKQDMLVFSGICRANYWALSNKIIPTGARDDEKLKELCERIIKGE